MRDHEGRAFWHVWTKGTFQLRVEKPPLFLGQQYPLNLGPVFKDDDPTQQLLMDADIAPAKSKVDLTLIGTVDSTTDALRMLTARLGAWHKTLGLHPPSQWNWRNKAAPDPTARAGRINIAKYVPQPDRPPLLAPQDYVAKRSEIPPEVVGFGPIPRHAPERAKFGGTYDKAWEQTQAPMLPTDLDPKFWQSAPNDQQIDRNQITGDALTLEGFIEDHPVAALPLPYLALDTQTKIGATWVRSEPALQAIYLDVSSLIATIAYVSTWEISSASADITVQKSVVMLRNAQTFRVAAQDHATFETNASGVAA